MSESRDDDFRCYDLVLLRKVNAIFAETDKIFLQALEHAGELAIKQISEAWEMPQILALGREHGFDAVQAALAAVKQSRLKAIEEIFGTTCEESIRNETHRHGRIDAAIDAARDPNVRLN